MGVQEILTPGTWNCKFRMSIQMLKNKRVHLGHKARENYAEPITVLSTIFSASYCSPILFLSMGL